jgi:BirA family biotin operon repressor/biotin-[acetyl-CoA-carboxylase] ligase
MLMPSDDLLDADLIRANLRTRQVGRKVLVYEQVSSTNDLAAEQARTPGNAGLVIFAEEQTAGRGRGGAKWHSARGDSLLFSVVLTDCAIDSELLSLTCAVAVAEAIGHVGGDQAAIRWPNDIMLDGRKVAGILLESRPDRTGRTYIVGIGVNCHQARESFPADLQATATSLDLVAGTRCERVTVAKRLLTSLDHWLRVAARSKKQVIETWSRLSTQLGQRVALSYNQKRFTGHCIGVDPEKGLILQLDHGGVRIFDAAHTHIVK